MKCKYIGLIIVLFIMCAGAAFAQMATKTIGVGDTDNSGSFTNSDAPDETGNYGDAWIAGEVGIGTTSPKTKLEVSGEIKIGSTNVACDANKPGAMRYNSTNEIMEYCDGGEEWAAIGAPVIGSNCVYRSTASPYDHVQCRQGEYMAGVQYENDNWANKTDNHNDPEVARILCCQFDYGKVEGHYPAPSTKVGGGAYPWPNKVDFEVISY